jgi:hypothetical protein
MAEMQNGAGTVFSLLCAISHSLEAAFLFLVFWRNPFDLPGMSGGLSVFALHHAIMAPLRVLNEYPLTPEPRVNRLHVRQRAAHTGAW